MNYADIHPGIRAAIEITILVWPVAGLGWYLSSMLDHDEPPDRRADRLWMLLCWGPLAWVCVLIGWLVRPMFRGRTVPIDEPVRQPPVACHDCGTCIMRAGRYAVGTNGAVRCEDCQRAVVADRRGR